MDGGILALVITVATLVGGAIGWLSRQYWYHRAAKREAALDARDILKGKKTLLEDRIARTKNSGIKSTLVSQRDDVDEALFALQGEMLGHALKDANLPTEGELIAAGRSHLKSQEVIPLKQGIEKVEAPLSSILVRDFVVLARAYYDAQRYHDAKRINDIILALNPNDPDALNNRGVIYAHLEKEV